MNRLSFRSNSTMRNRFTGVMCSVALGLAYTAVSFVSPTHAHAQSSEGQDVERGVAAGSMIITPRLRLGVGYDSNVNLNHNSEYSAASPELIISPSIGLRMRESGVVRFDANAGVTWRQYIAGDTGSNDASGMDVNAGVNLRVNHGGAVSLIVKDQLRQSNDAVYHPDLNDDPYEISFTDYGLDLGSGRVLTNNATLGLGFHPGGDSEDSIGFVGSLTANHIYNHYQERPSQDRQRIGGRLHLGWRFLPRSQVFVEANASRTLYKNGDGEPITRDVDIPLTPEGTFGLRNNDSTPVYAGVGLRSLILPRLGVMTRLGYSTAFYDEGPSPKRVAFQLQADSQLTRHMHLRAGYATNFADSTFGNYLNYHRFHASYSVTARPVKFTLSGFVQINDYAATDTELRDQAGNVVEFYNTGDRRDIPAGGSVELSVMAGNHVLIGANYSVLGNISNFDAEPARGWLNAQKLSGSPEFLRHRVYLFVALTL